jgi:hypothetical protein
MISAEAQCDGASFIFLTDGLVSLISDDSFRPGHRHQGIDIFAGITSVTIACNSDWQSELQSIARYN